MEEPEIRARRSHTKSKGGCGNCKRRHLRCDLFRPQCRNCLRHRVECDFTPVADNDSHAADSASSIPDIHFRPHAVEEIDDWVAQGRLELPMLPLEAQLPPNGMSYDELRLLHHCCAIFSEMAEGDVAKMTIWTGQLPVSTKGDKHIFHHRDIAYKGLRSAVESFAKENSDGVLGASIVLSWQMDTHKEWATFFDGVARAYAAMQPWKHESRFSFFLDEASHNPPPPEDVVRSVGMLTDEPRLVISRIRNSLEAVRPFMVGYEEQTKMVQQLLVFTENLVIAPPGPTRDEQYHTLSYVRGWLAWLPESCLHLRGRDPHVMLAFAQLYMVTLAVNPLFPAIGPGYFTAMRSQAILNINQALLDGGYAYTGAHDHNLSTSDLLELMKEPVHVAVRFAAQKHYGFAVGAL